MVRRLNCSQTPSVVNVIVVTRNQPKVLADVLERARHEQVTYEEVGRTRSNGLPSGYWQDRLATLLPRCS